MVIIAIINADGRFDFDRPRYRKKTKRNFEDITQEYLVAKNETYNIIEKIPKSFVDESFSLEIRLISMDDTINAFAMSEKNLDELIKKTTELIIDKTLSLIDIKYVNLLEK